MEYRELCSDIINKSLKAGADQAEVYLEEGKDLQIRVRKGELDVLKQTRTKGLGLRIFIQNKLGFSYTSDFIPESLEELLKKTIFIARNSSSDEFNGLPDNIEPASLKTNLKIYDKHLQEFPTEMKIELVKRVENAAFEFDPRIANTDGSEYSDSQTRCYLSNSAGGNLEFEKTNVSLVCSTIAEKDGEKRANYFWDFKSLLEDLDPPEKIGQTAAQRALRMLGSQKIKTQKVPIVFDSITASGFLSGLSYGVNGGLASKNSTFLAEKLNQKIGSDLLTIWDDGTMPKGVGSRPFDGEGVLTQRIKVFENGILKTFLHNSYSARKMKTLSTGNASRGYNSIPQISASNLYLENGKTNPEDIIHSVKNGFLVTELAGFGMDIVSGNFSQMAEGIWIENGELTYPVSQVTIGGTIPDMLKGIEMVGNDLVLRGSICSPTVKFSEMVVSGK